jgi:uncharacterized protein (DUF1800 family)
MRKPAVVIGVLFSLAGAASSGAASAQTAEAPSAGIRKQSAAAAIQTMADQPLNPRERAIQLLSRFTFGPRPGDVDRVLSMGTDQWFSAQLDPASIPDPTLEKRLLDYPTLTLTPEQAMEIFPDRGATEQVADGKRPYPADALKRSVYEVQVYKLRLERDDKLHPEAEQTEATKDAKKKVDQATAARIAGELFTLPKNERMAALDTMPPADRIAFASKVGGDQRNTLFAEFSPRERETIDAFQGGVGTQYRIIDELAQARELRNILSERQLQEVMTDFWFNHFNVFAPKDSDQHYTTSYERDVIRPNALGKFRDLLLATAQSPAMMVYLDNWLSIGPDSVANGVDPSKPNAKRGKKGLNENYGREVMELHTLGVNGGYSQADVTNLSEILTGWTVDRPNLGGPFLFDPHRHEPGPKHWLGYTLDEQGNVLSAPGGTAAKLSPEFMQAIAQAKTPDGMKQGITALSLLAASPKTAQFVCYLLAQRFVADDPPPALVNRMTATYLRSYGDIKTILRTMVESPEFNSRRYFRNKVKTPEEFVASAFRATATDPQNPGALVGLLTNQLGMPPYRKLEPTGYYVTADHWMNTQALLARLNFANQLTHNQFAGQKFEASRVLAFGLMGEREGELTGGQVSRVQGSDSITDASQGPDMALRVLETTLISGELSPKTDLFIRSQMAKQPANRPADTLNLLTALLLACPEFQLR